MARRYTKRTNKPKLPPRPKMRELRRIYKALLNLDMVQRTETLIRAYRWYLTAVEYCSLKKGLTEAQLQAYDDAKSLWNSSLSVENYFDKEKALRAALNAFQIVCSLVKPPKLDAVYSKLASKEAKYRAQAERLMKKYDELISTIKLALNPQNYNGKPAEVAVASIDKQRDIQPLLGTVTYSRDHAKFMLHKVKKVGLFAVIVEEIDTFARLASLIPRMEPGRDLIYVTNPEKEAAARKQLLHNFLTFVTSQPCRYKLFKKGVIPKYVRTNVTVKTERKPRKPRVVAKKKSAKRKPVRAR